MTEKGLSAFFTLLLQPLGLHGVLFDLFVVFDKLHVICPLNVGHSAYHVVELGVLFTMEGSL